MANNFTKMYNDLMSYALQNLTFDEYKVWQCLCRYWNEKDKCSYPTREQISAYTGINSPNRISNVTTSLQNKNFIKKGFSKKGDRQYSNNVYYIHGINTQQEYDNVESKPERKDKGVHKEFPVKKVATNIKKAIKKKIYSKPEIELKTDKATKNKIADSLFAELNQIDENSEEYQMLAVAYKNLMSKAEE